MPYNLALMESLEVLNAVEQGWLRVHEIAAYLGVTQQRVSQLAANDGFPAARMFGDRRLWKRSAVERWADHHRWGTKPWRS